MIKNLLNFKNTINKIVLISILGTFTFFIASSAFAQVTVPPGTITDPQTQGYPTCTPGNCQVGPAPFGAATGSLQYWNGSTSATTSSQIVIDATGVTLGSTTISSLSLTGINTTNGTITNSSSTNFFSSLINAISAIFINLTSTNATITNATTTNLAITNGLKILSGGTGTTTAPSYGQVLVGNTAGGYDYVATSSFSVATATFAQSTTLGASVTNATATGIFFLGADGKLSQDTANFNYDATTKKLTVTGGIDPLYFQAKDVLTTGQNTAYYEAYSGDAAGLSSANTGRLRYSTSTQSWQISNNGGAYQDIIVNGGNISWANATGGNATITNIYSNGRFSLSNGTIIGANITDATITNATTTNLFANLFNAVSAFISTITAGIINVGTINATTTINTLALNASTTNASTTNSLVGNITNLNTDNATITNSTSSSIFSTVITAITGIFTNLTGTNATITNATTTNLASSNISASTQLTNSGTTTLSTTSVSNLSISDAAILASTTPSTTTNALYNVNGNLYFNGTQLGVAGAGTEWQTINNSGVRLSTTSNSVVIGASATSTNDNFQVIGTAYINGTTTLATTTITNGVITNIAVAGGSATLTDATSTFLQIYNLTAATTTLGTTTISTSSITNLNVLATLWANILNVFGFTAENATITNATTSNIATTNLTATGTTILANANATNATITNSTSTNIFATLLTAITGIFTNLTGTNATLTNATSTNLAIDGGIVNTGTLFVTGTSTLSTTTQASSTISTANISTANISNLNISGLSVPNATISYATVTNDLAVTNLNATGTITSVNGIFTNGTITNATSTNLVSANISNTNLTSVDATITNATTTNLFANLFNAVSAFISTITAGIINVGTINATTTINTLALNASTTNASTTNTIDLVSTGTSTFATTTAASSTVGTANIGTANISNLNISGLSVPNATISFATVTNDLAATNINASGTLSVSGTSTLSTSTVSSSSITWANITNLFAQILSVLNLNATNATITNATSSNIATGVLNATTSAALASTTLSGNTIAGSLTAATTSVSLLAVGTSTNASTTLTAFRNVANGGVTWTSRSASEANTWSSVTYGNGTYVAVSGSGTNRVMTSSDGITWTARSASEANPWWSVTYGGGQFVAVSTSGTNRVMTSPNGVTWTARAASAASAWRSVVYANGKYVAVADSGATRVMTSTDGITWTSQTGVSSNWRSVAYGNGVYVAVAEFGSDRVMTSPDGITWTAQTAVEANSWQSVIYAGGQFVAVALDGTNQVMTSPNGVTWTARAASEASAWNSVTYANGTYVAVASSGTNRVMTSSDAITWVSRSASEASIWYSVTAGNGLLVAVAVSGTNQVMTSVDGPTGSTNLLSLGTSLNSNVLVVDDRGYVGVGTTTGLTNLFNINGAITLNSSTPASTANALYSQSGTLYFNGLALATGTSPFVLNGNGTITTSSSTAVLTLNNLTATGTTNLATTSIATATIAAGTANLSDATITNATITNISGTNANLTTITSTGTSTFATTTAASSSIINLNVLTNLWAALGNFLGLNVNGNLAVTGTSTLATTSITNLGVGTSTNIYGGELTAGLTLNNALVLASSTALSTTTSALYNVNGTLYFNGSAVASGGLPASSTSLYVTADGKVAIGTSTPSANLDVIGSIKSQINSSSNISTAGTLTASGHGGRGMVKQGDYVFTTGDTNTVRIVDVSVPTSPRLITNYTMGTTSANNMAIVGKYLYVTHRVSPGVVTTHDISNISAPVQVATTTLTHNSANRIVQNGKYLYIMSIYAAGLSVLDTSNGIPTVVSTNGSFSTAQGYLIHNNYLYTTAGGLRTYSLTDPTNPTLVNTTSIPGGTLMQLSVSGRYGYVPATSLNVLATFDFLNPAAPVFVASSSMQGGTIPIGTFATQKNVYVANNGDSIFSVFDVNASSTKPILVATTSIASLNEAAQSLIVSGNYAYLNNASDLKIVSLSGIETGSLLAGNAEIGELTVLQKLIAQASLLVKDLLQVDGNANIGGTLSANNATINKEIVLGNNTPATTTNALYNQGGTLYFNGSAVASGGLPASTTSLYVGSNGGVAIGTTTNAYGGALTQGLTLGYTTSGGENTANTLVLASATSTSLISTSTNALYNVNGSLYFNGNILNNGVAASYMEVRLTSTQSATTNDHVNFSSVMNQYGNDITLDTSSGYVTTNNTASQGRFTLKAGKTYRLTGNLGDVGFASSGTSNYAESAWYNVDTGTIIGVANLQTPSYNSDQYDSSQGETSAVFTPSVDTRVELRIVDGNNLQIISGPLSTVHARAFIEVIAGNAAVTGQSVDYVRVGMTNSSLNVATGSTVIFNSVQAGNISYNTSTGVFTLTAGKTYDLIASLAFQTWSLPTTGQMTYEWVDATTNLPLAANSAGWAVPPTYSVEISAQQSAKVVYTPTTNQTIKLRIQSSESNLSVNGNANILGSASFAQVTQLGSSATTEYSNNILGNFTASSTIMSGTLSEYVNHIQIVQASSSLTLTIPSPANTSLSRIVYIDNTGTANFDMHGVTVGAGETAAFKWNGTTWKSFGNQAANVAAENGEVTTITDGQTTTSTSFVDVTGSSFTIPSAGTWRVTYVAQIQNSTSGSTIFTQLTDSSGTLVPGSYIGGTSVSGLSSRSQTAVVTITTTSPATYKMQWKVSANTGAMYNNTGSNGQSGQSRITYQKIGGYLPVIGQTVDYITAVQTVNQSFGASDHFRFDTVLTSGGVTLDTTSPYVTTTNTASVGRFTLLAGKTYTLYANVGEVIVTDTGQVTLQWYNSDTGVAIGNPAQGVPASGGNFGGIPAVEAVFTPTVNTRVELRNTTADITGTNSTGNKPYVRITQLGSTAITGVTWSSLIAPIANLTTNMSTFATNFSWSATTSSTTVTDVASTTGLFNLTANSLSIGNLLNIDTSLASSSVLAMRVKGSIAKVFGTNFATTTAYAHNVDFGNTSRVRVLATVSAFQGITGIANGQDGEELTIINASSTQSFVLYDHTSTTTSSAANRIITGTNSNLTLAGDAAITLVYDSTASSTGRWRVVGGTGGGTSVSSTNLTNFTASSSVGTAALTVDTYTNLNIAQASTSVVLTLPNPTVTTAGKTITVNNTGTAAFTMHDVQVPSQGSGIFVWNGSFWASIEGKGSVAAEYGENTTISDAQTTTSASLTDVTGGSFTLPSAGVWEVEYKVFAQNTTNGTVNYQTFVITDNSNNAVASCYSSNEVPASNTSLAQSQVCRITTTGAATYKLRWSTVSGTATLYNNSNNGNSKIAYKKISGNAAMVGQTVDYGQYTYTNTGGFSISTNDTVIPLDTTVSGNIPLTSNRFTLTAGKTYRLVGAIPYTGNASANIDTQFYNVTTGSYIGQTRSAILNGSFSSTGYNEVIFTATTTSQVEFRVRSVAGGAYALVSGDVTRQQGPSVTVTQLGSNATTEYSNNALGNFTASSTITATLSEYVNHYQILQTTPAITLTIPNPTNTALSRIIYIDNTGTANFQMHDVTVGAGETVAFKWNGTTWKSFGNQAANVASEYGQTLITNTAQTTSSGTYSDVLTSDFTLPSAGVWRVSYYLYVYQTSANGGALAKIVDSSDVDVADSVATVGGSSGTTNTVVPLTNTVNITTTGPQTYNLQWARNTGGTVNLGANASHRVVYEKISGYLPVTGQMVDYVLAKKTAIQTITTSADQGAVTWQSTAGNIPLVSGTTTLFQLTAGKTYKLEAHIALCNAGSANCADSGSGTGGGRLRYRWVDSSNNPVGTVNAVGITKTTTGTTDSNSDTNAVALFTPTVDTQVKLYVFDVDTSNMIISYGNTVANPDASSDTYASIEQLGTSAITSESVLANGGQSGFSATFGTLTNNFARIIASSTEYMRVLATGQGLIGTTTINTTIGTSTLAIVGTTTNGTVNIFSVSSSSGANVLTITNGGNVGLGIASPGANLDVVGRSTSAADSQLFRVASSSGTNALTVLGNGLVTVGTQATTSNQNLFMVTPAVGAGLGIGWNVSGGGGETDFFNYSQAGAGGFRFYNHVAPGTTIPSNSVANLLMTITSDGNVGIGTSTPNAKLVVVGTTTLATTTIASSSITNLNVLSALWANLLSAINFTATNATITNATSTNLNVSGIATIATSSITGGLTIGQVGSSDTKLEIADSNITSGNVAVISGNGVTTGNVLSLQGDTITSGSILNVQNNNDVFTSGGLLKIYGESTNKSTNWNGSLASIEYVGNNTSDVNANALKVGFTGSSDTSNGTALNITSSQEGANALVLRVNDDGTYTDSTPFVIGANGNVGIGTSTPGSTLHIARIAGANSSGIELLRLSASYDGGGTAGAGGYLSFTDENNIEVNRIRSYNESNGNVGLAFSTMNAAALSEKMRLAASGQLSIGTTTSSGMLYVKSNSATTWQTATLEGSATGDQTVGLRLLNGSTTAQRAWHIAVGGDGNGVGAADGDFYIRDESNSLDRLFIKRSTGYIGINNNTPTANLTVTNTVATTGTQFLNWGNATQQLGALMADPSNTSAGALNLYNGNIASSTLISANGPSWFNGGNVGIGTTTSTYRLELQASNDFAFRTHTTADSQWIMTANGGQNVLSARSAGSNMYLNNPSGNLYLGATTSGSPGNLDTKLSILTGGNVGIGTSTPSYLTHLVGSNSASGDTAGLLTLNNTNTNGFSSMMFTDNVGNAKLQVGYGNSLSPSPFTNSSFINATGSSDLKLLTNGVLGLVLKNNGSLYVGTTTDSYSSNSRSIISGSAVSGSSALTIANFGAGLGWGQRFIPVNNGMHYMRFDNSAATQIGQIVNGSNGTDFGMIAVTDLILGGGNSEKMRINAAGGVGIGTTTPDQILSLNAANAGIGIRDTATGNMSWLTRFTDRLQINSNDDIRLFGGATANTNGNGLVVESGGHVRPGTNNTLTLGTGTFRWTEVFATNGVINTSDARLKENVLDLTNNDGLDTVLALRPVTYNWIDKGAGNQKNFGFLAQEVYNINPELVTGTTTGSSTLGINYTNFIPLLTKAVQQLNSKIFSSGTQQAISIEEITASSTISVDDKLKALGMNAKQVNDMLAQIASSTSATSSVTTTETPNNTVQTLSCNANNTVGESMNGGVITSITSTTTRILVEGQIPQTIYSCVVTTYATTTAVTEDLTFIGKLLSRVIEEVKTYLATATEVFVGKVKTNEICMTKSDGTPVCLNADQLEGIKNSLNTPSSPAPAPTPEPLTCTLPEVLDNSGTVCEIPAEQPPAFDPASCALMTPAQNVNAENTACESV